MPNKDRPLVDRHPQKHGEGWLLNEQKQLIVCFRNALSSAPAKRIQLETRPMRGSGQPIVRRMRRHNGIGVCPTIRKSDAWKRCVSLTSWRKKSKAFEIV